MNNIKKLPISKEQADQIAQMVEDYVKDSLKLEYTSFAHSYTPGTLYGEKVNPGIYGDPLTITLTFNQDQLNKNIESEDFESEMAAGMRAAKLADLRKYVMRMLRKNLKLHVGSGHNVTTSSNPREDRYAITFDILELDKVVLPDAVMEANGGWIKSGIQSIVIGAIIEWFIKFMEHPKSKEVVKNAMKKLIEPHVEKASWIKSLYDNLDMVVDLVMHSDHKEQLTAGLRKLTQEKIAEAELQDRLYRKTNNWASAVLENAIIDLDTANAKAHEIATLVSEQGLTPKKALLETMGRNFVIPKAATKTNIVGGTEPSVSKADVYEFNQFSNSKFLKRNRLTGK